MVAVSFIAFDRGQSSFVYRSYPVPSSVWSVICAVNIVFCRDSVSAGDTSQKYAPSTKTIRFSTCLYAVILSSLSWISAT